MAGDSLCEADFLPTSLENKKNPGFACRGIWHFKCRGGRQFEYAPEKLRKSPGWGEPESLKVTLLGCIGWDGEIAAYANNQHRHTFSVKGL